MHQKATKIMESTMSDEMTETEDECYDIAWFNEDGYIDLKSLAVVFLSSCCPRLEPKRIGLAGRILRKGTRTATQHHVEALL